MTEPDAEGAALRERLRRFMHLMRQVTADPEGRDAFSGQGRVLRLLSMRSPVAQKELAYVLGIRSQSLAELLAKLEEKGLISREPNPADRRTSIVTLTDAGRAEALAQAGAEEFDPFSSLSPAERSDLASLLDKLIAAAESQLPAGEFPPAPLKWPPPAPPGDSWGPPPRPGRKPGPGDKPGPGREAGPRGRR